MYFFLGTDEYRELRKSNSDINLFERVVERLINKMVVRDRNP